PVYALALGGVAGRSPLFIGGDFTRAHNGPALNRIGKFDLYYNRWESLGNGVAGVSTPVVRSIVVAAVPSANNFATINLSLVYVGGRFTEATNPDGSKTLCRNLMLWRNISERWQALGNGVDDEVLALALAPNHSLYVGGRFTEAVNYDGSTTRFLNRIALWNGYYYSPLGYGVNGAVTTIASSFDRNRIFVGGEFTEATNSNLTRKAAKYIAVFNRTHHPGFALEWDVFGSGVNSVVNSIVPVRPCPAGSASEALHVGGAFNQAGNKNALAMAKWKYLGIKTRPSRSGLAIEVLYSCRSRCRSGNPRGSRAVMAFIHIPPCSPGLGKSAATADTILFDNLGFRESADLPELPYMQQFSLQVYDVENLGGLITGTSVEITSFNPQLLVHMGVDDTTAYARNPDGVYTGETLMLHDLPILTDNPGEVRAVFVHGGTDAPTIDIVATTGDTIVRSLRYGAVSDPVSIAAGNYTVDLIRRRDKQKLATYSFDVSNQANGYVALTLSGFLDPAANQNGPGMELSVYPVKLAPVTAVAERDEMVPASFELSQNYPNPFNPMTSIQYSVSSDQFVSLKVYDVHGREVATLVDERKSTGSYRVTFDAKGLSSGVYFVKMRAGYPSTGSGQRFAATRKILLMR
ncbi:MAG: T9SS type A sorting domain-containing protein, partial [bacterium]